MMNRRQKLWLSSLVVAGALAFTLPARAGVDVDVNIGAPQPTVTTYHYVYYPTAEVYFVPETRVYWFFEGGTWRSAPQPPPGITLGTSIKLDWDKPEPWSTHEVVVKKYGGKHHKIKIKEKD